MTTDECAGGEAVPHRVCACIFGQPPELCRSSRTDRSAARRSTAEVIRLDRGDLWKRSELGHGRFRALSGRNSKVIDVNRAVPANHAGRAGVEHPLAAPLTGGRAEPMRISPATKSGAFDFPCSAFTPANAKPTTTSTSPRFGLLTGVLLERSFSLLDTTKVQFCKHRMCRTTQFC